YLWWLFASHLPTSCECLLQRSAEIVSDSCRALDLRLGCVGPNQMGELLSGNLGLSYQPAGLLLRGRSNYRFSLVHRLQLLASIACLRPLRGESLLCQSLPSVIVSLGLRWDGFASSIRLGRSDLPLFGLLFLL